jgi:predicted nucleic acid-binding protein
VLVVDSGALLSALDRRDAHHGACSRLVRAERVLVIPAPVLVEVDYWCAQKGLDEAFDDVLREVQLGVMRVEELTFEDRARVLDLRSTYRDMRVGFVDAAILAIVERLGERKLATLDRRHFAVMHPRHVDALELLPG